NTNNPPLIQTVAMLAVSDGRGGTSTTSYSYAGGLFDYLSRRSLGFHYEQKVLDAPNDGCTSGSTRPFEETWFAQDYASVSKPQRIRFTDDRGSLLSDRQLVYRTNGATAPYQSLLVWDTTYEYAPGSPGCSSWPCATGKRTAVSHTYDVWN